jgi:prephenate dehydrogenase
MTPQAVEKLALVGVGLIGGSFALALRERGLVREVVGIGRSRSNLEQALERRIIDSIGHDCAAARDAELVLVATPVAQMPRVFADLAKAVGDECIVTDAGSTKQDVIRGAREAFGERMTRFVPAHPIAGTEKNGAAAAFASLYEGRKVVLTPEAETNPCALARVQELWRACGAEVRTMPASRHDAIFAAVSHLPHLLAFALVDELASRQEAAEFFAYAASGFRDFTRIAGSDPEMWRDISVANRDALQAELDRYGKQIERLRHLLQDADEAGLEEMFRAASNARRAWEGRSA